MKKFMKILMCNILVLASLHLKAQNRDYVITADGEKIPCTITFPAFHNGGVYKTAGARETVPITLGEIREYYTFKDRTLYRKVLRRPGKEGSAKFMEVLENGKINLYQEIIKTSSMTANGGMYSNEFANWFISKGSDTLTLIKNSDLLISALYIGSRKSRENVLAEMIKDNKDVYDKYLTDEKFSFEQVRNLIHLYNTGNSFGSDVPPTPRDFVIKKNKDTIFCEIEPASSAGPGRYRITPQDKFVKIDTAITAYFLAKDSTTFLLKTLPGDKRPKYLKCLVSGGINLYTYSLNNAAADEEASLYASKQNDGLVLLKDEFRRPGKNEKKAFNDLISDNPNLANKFESQPYNYSSILDCVKMYDSDYTNKAGK